MAVSLSQRFRFVFFISVSVRRVRRNIRWLREKSSLVWRKLDGELPHVVFKHSSVLVRKLEGVDLQLQHNKVKNLKIVSEILNGLLIQPGEKFSLYKLVGKPTIRRGFVNGLELSRGKMKGEIGGGLCQIANMLHWMILHTDMDVVERHHHSVDIFPDSGRKVPFGTGATLFYNFKDFVFQNNTNKSYQLVIFTDDDYLQGRILSSFEDPESYKVFEEAHCFEKNGNDYFRMNQIWRENLKTGEKKMLFSNKYKTLYTPSVELLST